MAGKNHSRQIFNDAAEGVMLKPRNGLDYLNDAYIKKSDVTIFSDFHFTSGTKYRDFLSDKNLGKFAAAGVRQIHVEIPEQFDDLRRGLSDGKLTPGQFVRDMDARKFLFTGIQDYKKFYGEIADAVLHAKKHGIDMHFSQIAFKPDQDAAIRDYAKNNSETLGRSYVTKALDIQQYLIDAGVSDRKLQRFMATLLPRQVGLDGIDLENVSGKPFRDELVPDQRKTLDQKIDDLKSVHGRFLQTQAGFEKMIVDYRASSDTALADRVTSTLGGGKALLLHGSIHGGRDDHDVDDILAAKGLKVTRINLTYGEVDKDVTHDISEGKMMTDPSDIYYDPRKDNVEVIDTNHNGILNAGPAVHEPMPRR